MAVSRPLFLLPELFGRLLFTWEDSRVGSLARKTSRRLIDELRSFSISQIMFLASGKETGIKRGRRRADINLPADSQPGPLSIITRLLAPGWGDGGRVRALTVSPVASGKASVIKLWLPGTGRDGPAVLGVMDCSSAQPLMVADTLIDARARPG